MAGLLREAGQAEAQIAVPLVSVFLTTATSPRGRRDARERPGYFLL